MPSTWAPNLAVCSGCHPRWYADVSANLTIANMDFAEFADATDGSGAFRGFDGD